MITYCVGFLFLDHEFVLLVEKKFPKWMEGLLNGVGGKMESRESALATMHRETKEETGITELRWDLFGMMSVPAHDGIVHVYRAFDNFNVLMDIPYSNDVEEKLLVFPLNEFPKWQDLCVPNLKYLIPIALDPEISLVNITYNPEE